MLLNVSPHLFPLIHNQSLHNGEVVYLILLHVEEVRIEVFLLLLLLFILLIKYSLCLFLLFLNILEHLLIYVYDSRSHLVIQLHPRLLIDLDLSQLVDLPRLAPIQVPQYREEVRAVLEDEENHQEGSECAEEEEVQEEHEERGRVLEEVRPDTQIGEGEDHQLVEEEED